MYNIKEDLCPIFFWEHSQSVLLYFSEHSNDDTFTSTNSGFRIPFLESSLFSLKILHYYWETQLDPTKTILEGIFSCYRGRESGCKSTLLPKKG